MFPNHLYLIARCGHDMPRSREGTYKKTLNTRQSEHFLDYFRQIPFSNRLKVFLFI